MKFTRMKVDPAEWNTWLVGRPSDATGGRTDLDMFAPLPYRGSLPIRATTYAKGPMTAVHFGAGGVLYMHCDALRLLREDLGDDAQTLPLELDGEEGLYEAVHIHRVVDCIDHTRVAGARYPESFPNPNVVGHYEWVSPLLVLPEVLGSYAIARPVDFRGAVIVSERVSTLLAGIDNPGVVFETAV